MGATGVAPGRHDRPGRLPGVGHDQGAAAPISTPRCARGRSSPAWTPPSSRRGWRRRGPTSSPRAPTWSARGRPSSTPSRSTSGPRRSRKQDLVPQSDLESAKAAYDGARAQLLANQAAVSQSEAALNQAQVDLGHTVITAPIDGVVLARNVDVGQTVAASLQAPVLFVIANDLTRMQVNASIDEADIGRVKAGQEVTFRVDAFPDETFRGRLEQVRLQPVVAQNVVTYNTIVAVDNKGQRLMPGMTATVSVVDRGAQGRAAPSRGGAALPARGLRGGRGREGRARGRGRSAPGAASVTHRARRPRRREASRAGGAGPAAPVERAAQGEGRAEAVRRRPRLVFLPGRPTEGPSRQRVRLGVSDGRFVEVSRASTEGATVVTGAEEGGRPRAPGPLRAAPTIPSSPSASTPRPRQ